jgi:single-strand DNA-binding protein
MINSVCLIGNLGGDPEMRYLQSGTKIATMRLAVTEFWRDRASGERQSRTHWFTVKAFGPLAETCERYLRKGVKVAIQGQLEYREWSAQDGSKRTTVEVRMRGMEMLTPRSEDSRSAMQTEELGPPPETSPFQDEDDIPF